MSKNTVYRVLVHIKYEDNQSRRLSFNVNHKCNIVKKLKQIKGIYTAVVDKHCYDHRTGKYKVSQFLMNSK